MKVITGILLFLVSISLNAQENESLTKKLKNKYGWACYHDSNGGWYEVHLGDYQGKEGVCDLKGKEIVPPIYGDVYYSGDYYTVTKNGKKGILDAKGKEIIPCTKYDEIDTYTIKEFGYWTVLNNGKEGILDENLKEIIPCNKYNQIFYYQTKEYGGYCEVIRDGKKGIIDKVGNEIVPCKYDDMYQWELKDKEMCRVMNYEKILGQEKQNSRLGVVDIHGNEILPCEYTDITFCDDAIVAGKGGNRYRGEWTAIGAKYALYSLSQKKFVTDFKYDYISYYSQKEDIVSFNLGGEVSYENGKGVKVSGGKWGYLNGKGKELIAAQYDEAGGFNDGVAQVSKNGVTSMITNPEKGTSLQLTGDMEVSMVDRDIPQTGKTDENMFAFIFSIENYNHLSGADYAINDGKVFAEYCRKTIGIPENNVRYYEDATYGNLIGAIKKIKDIADVYEGDAKILFYFSGLGATDDKTKERYLLLADASMETLTSTGYNVATLQSQLNELPTSFTLVILDVPFTNRDRMGKALASSRGVQLVPQSLKTEGKVMLCLGSKDDETAFASKQLSHGLFTYGLLHQLQATKGDCNLKALMENSSKWVAKESLKLCDKVQTPQQIVSADMNTTWTNIKF